ncbi:type I restriction-modification system subunit M [Pelagibacteraceae bacterium]|nr:type I restriction-modification system subunit M [Pelagibacteraceae bacterium]MDC0365751.1 type I restriction-modification system subunit M [Pelagibacteraceae bacterium]
MVKKSETNDIDFKATLWKSADKLRNQMDAAEYKHIVLGLIFLKYISDTFDIQKNKIKKMVSDKKSDLFISEDPKVYEKELEDRDYYTQDNVFWVPQKARWEKIRSQAKQPDIGSIIDKSMVEIENENKSLQGKLDKRFGRTQLEAGKLGELIDLISKIGFTDEQKASDLLGEVYEYFLGQFATAEGKKGGQFYTPGHIVKTLVAVLSPHKGRIYDPCCGSGGMFIQSEEFVKTHGGKIDDVSIYGQESNPTTWRLAAMNLAIRGLSVDLGKIHGDTFANDQFPDLKFDYIMANPPFNISDWDGEKYENDVRWKFGRPPVGNANYAWLQHILWKLKTGGQAGIVLANGSMSSNTSGEGQIREAMIEGDIVEVMISLPGKLFLNTQIPCCLWFLTNDKTKNGRDRRNETLFIDGRNLGSMKTKALKILTNEDIQKIKDTVFLWRKGEGYEDIKGFCNSSINDDIKKNNFVLTPGRYVGFAEGENDSVSFDEKIKVLINDLKKIQSESKDIEIDINKNLRKFFNK